MQTDHVMQASTKHTEAKQGLMFLWSGLYLEGGVAACDSVLDPPPFDTHLASF